MDDQERIDRATREIIRRIQRGKLPAKIKKIQKLLRDPDRRLAKFLASATIADSVLKEIERRINKGTEQLSSEEIKSKISENIAELSWIHPDYKIMRVEKGDWDTLTCERHLRFKRAINAWKRGLSAAALSPSGALGVWEFDTELVLSNYEGPDKDGKPRHKKETVRKLLRGYDQHGNRIFGNAMLPVVPGLPCLQEFIDHQPFASK